MAIDYKNVGKCFFFKEKLMTKLINVILKSNLTLSYYSFCLN